VNTTAQTVMISSTQDKTVLLVISLRAIEIRPLTAFVRGQKGKFMAPMFALAGC
jgi:hypothetical protein